MVDKKTFQNKQEHDKLYPSKWIKQNRNENQTFHLVKILHRQGKRQLFQYNTLAEGFILKKEFPYTTNV
jgi:hypothetical protein